MAEGQHGFSYSPAPVAAEYLLAQGLIYQPLPYRFAYHNYDQVSQFSANAMEAMAIVITFLAIYLSHIVLMAFVMRVINGRFFYGLFLGLCAPCWPLFIWAVTAGLVSGPAWASNYAFALIMFLPGLLFAFEYHKQISPKNQAFAESIFIRSMISPFMMFIGFPVFGAIYCVWLLLFKQISPR